MEGGAGPAVHRAVQKPPPWELLKGAHVRKPHSSGVGEAESQHGDGQLGNMIPFFSLCMCEENPC